MHMFIRVPCIKSVKVCQMDRHCLYNLLTVVAKIIRPPSKKNLFFLYLGDESGWKSGTFTML